MKTQMAAAEIGRFIRQRRNASKLTQMQLAEIAGVGQRFISELERGKPTLRLAEVERVLAIFGKRLGIIDRPPESFDEHEQ